MSNVPEVALGIVAVSRDCFPAKLSMRRRAAVVNEVVKAGYIIYEAQTIVENENDVIAALAELTAANVNALVVYLGNFGPEGPETLLAQQFAGPVMFAAAAEETGNDLFDGRGDAYCGMLNASYNIGLRGLSVYIPENPVGTAADVAGMITGFSGVARVWLGVKKLKIFSFGPRPFDFLACNAPIKPLYDLGIEIQENSELDLFASFNDHAGDKRIAGVVADMENELGAGNKFPGVLTKLAQYELTLLDWAENNKGASEYFAFANKCWPAFQKFFGFVPCYVNGRLAGRNIPVACETDIYGAVSEYILTAASEKPVTLLDINNTVPADMFENDKQLIKGYKPTDIFMGFHCGNTPGCYLKKPEMKYQLIMKRLLEPDAAPDITRGTLEGDIGGSDVTIFRLQSTAACAMTGYMAQGETLDMDTQSFGGIGVVAIPEMGRFYRHVLIERRYPHHTGVAFKHVGKILFDAMKLLGVNDIQVNKPAGQLYTTENPFA